MGTPKQYLPTITPNPHPRRLILTLSGKLQKKNNIQCSLHRSWQDSWESDFIPSQAKPTREFTSAADWNFHFTLVEWKNAIGVHGFADSPPLKTKPQNFRQLRRLHQIILIPRVRRFFRFLHGSTFAVVLFKALIVNSSCIASLCRSFLIFFCLCRPSYRAPYVLHRRGRSGPTVRVHLVQVIMGRSLEFVFLRNKLSCSIFINYHIRKVFNIFPPKKT